VAVGGRAAWRARLPAGAVEGVDPFLGLSRRKDQLVAAEELHERGPVRPHLLPRLLDFLRIAVDQFGQPRRQFKCDLRDLRGIGLVVGSHRPGDQPRVRDLADGNKAGVHESVLGQRPESDRTHVGVRPVLQIINKVQQDERVPVFAADLEDPFHRVAPAAQHLPVSHAQIRPAGQELFQHGLAVRQTVLKCEPVDGGDRFVLDQQLLGTDVLPHGPFQVPFEPRAEREADQGPLQFRAPLDEPGERRLVATVVHRPWCHVTPSNPGYS